MVTETTHSSIREAEISSPRGKAELPGGNPDRRVLEPRLEAEQNAEKVHVRRARRLGLVLMIVSALASLALLSALWLGLSGAF